AYTTTYKNNPFLDDGYIKKLKDMLVRNPRRAKVAVLGEWGVAEGLVFNNFDAVEFDINKKIQEIGTTVHGMDFGFTHDPTTLPSAVYDDKNHELWIYDELYKTGLLSDQIVREIKKRNLMAAKIHADAASAMTIAELKHKG
ncbi:terminase large subunit, partial [Lactiplantibacillus plantarum]|uniref:terminase large subunit n=1 Tax=Lactiplantibacillus plantarum TaxID=1590 RepID=UPI002DE6BB33|nr:terminase large subunit [Lactiplantibacillus plantarum]